MSNLHHGNLNFSNVRIVNLGTGSKTSDTPPRKREKSSILIPEFIQFTIFLKRTLTEIATRSEGEADRMRLFAQRDRDNNLLYDRLSATNGVCWIKMDKYKELQKIESLTNEWLKIPETRQQMRSLANDMALEYLTRVKLRTNTLVVP